MRKKEKVYGPLTLAPRTYKMYGRVKYSETLPPMLAEELRDAGEIDDFIAIIYQLAERNDGITDDIYQVLADLGRRITDAEEEYWYEEGYCAVRDYIESGKASPIYARLVMRTINKHIKGTLI